MSSFGFFSLASVPNVPVRCLSVFSSLPVLDMTEGKWSGSFHTSWKSAVPTEAERRRSGSAGCSACCGCTQPSCRAARGETAASAAPAWSNRAAVLGNLCATEECCWERSLTPGFLQRVRGELLQTFKQHGHGVRCSRVRGAAARRQRGDLAALSRPPPLELPLLPAVPRPPRVPHRAPSAATKSKKNNATDSPAINLKLQTENSDLYQYFYSYVPVQTTVTP